MESATPNGFRKRQEEELLLARHAMTLILDGEEVEPSLTLLCFRGTIHGCVKRHAANVVG